MRKREKFYLKNATISDNVFIKETLDNASYQLFL